MSDLVTVGLLATFCTLVAITSITVMRKMRKNRIRQSENNMRREKTTYFLDEGDEKKPCEICLGAITDHGVAECVCGKVFHEACARPTGACPYCGCRFEEMRVRAPRRPRCPVCGRYVRGSICACGAVLPRSDNTFLCSCGNRVDTSSPVCSVCNATYARTVMTSRKGKDKKH
jgi:hypothetical protein